MLSKSGEYKTIVKDKVLDWPDNVRFGDESWLYIAVNKLHKSKSFNGVRDKGTKSFKIMRVWTGTKSVAGK